MIPRVTGAEHAQLAAAIDDAFSRLDVRMRTRGESFAALSAAMRRAGSGGKRFRPALVVGAFQALGGDARESPAVLSVAAAFELLHTAFVIHDDLIDGDTVRRGVPNVAGEFRLRADGDDGAVLGDTAALLAGDLLLHEAQRIVATIDTATALRRRLLDLLDEAVIVTAAGELADVEHAARPGSDVRDVLAMSHDKTAAYSFSAPLRAGALLAGADEVTTARVGACGSALGLAYQLVDDLIGAFGTEAQAGRAPGADLVAAKHTPLVAMARETQGWPTLSDTIALARTGPLALREAQRALDESGARSQSESLVRQLLDEVRTDAFDLPHGLGRLLRECADGVEGRIP
jgi:geranylgeranyl diphosphate synthase type II